MVSPFYHGSRSRTASPWHRLVNGGLALLLVGLLASAAVLHAPRHVAAQGAASTTAALAPASSLVFLRVNLDTTSSQYQKAAQLLVRAGVASSVDELLGKLTTSGASTVGENVGDLSNITPFLGGEIGIVISSFGLPQAGGLSQIVGNLPVATPSADQTPGFALIVDAGDDAAAWAKAQELLQQEADQAGAQVAEETYDGTSISYVPGDESTGQSGTAIAQVGSFIVLSDKPDIIKTIIDVHTGKATAIADADGFKAVLAELPSDNLLFGYVNGTALATEMERSLADSGMDLSSLGAEGLNADSGFAVRADDPGFRSESVTIPAAGSTMPPLTSFEATLPSKVPGDTLFFVDGYNLGASGILDGLFLAIIQAATGSMGGGEIATPVPGMSPEEFAAQQFEQFAQVLGFNIKTDFIDQMEGEYGLAVWGLGADATGQIAPEKIGVLFTSAVKDAATLNNALTTISFLVQSVLQGSGTLTTKTIGTDTIWVGTFGTDSGTPFTVEFGIVNGQFAISTNDAISLLATPASSTLADNPTYQAALAELPSDHGFTMYVDVKQMAELSAVASAMAETGGSKDASEKCADYSSQEAAQEAFDSDPALNWELDQDFDGQACEDYFATPAAEATPPVNVDQLGAFPAFAMVAYQDGNLVKTSAILLVEK
ncbi:MAG: hypothetical protein C4345_03775 [Chloroflexota bacterium]